MWMAPVTRIMNSARRATRRTLVAAMLVMLTGAAVVVGTRWWALARPHVAWSFTSASNRLSVGVQAGRGPLAPWVFSHLVLRINGHDASGPRWAGRLVPGEHVAWRVAARGWDGTAVVHVALHVPPGPRVSHIIQGATALTVTFSRPVVRVQVLGSPPGPPLPVQGGDQVSLPREVNVYRVTLDAVDRQNEQSQLQVEVPALSPVPLVWFASRAGRHVYITIDDGWYPSATILRLMHSEHVPITAFLIQQAVVQHLGYWKAFVAAGGVVEDHTVSHPYLTQLSAAGALAQWRGPVVQYPTWLGQTPTVARPPYGAYDGQVERAAHAAGLSALIMWSAEWTPGHGMVTWNRGPLAPGEILLLHWVPGLGRELVTLLRQLKAAHLTPAPLLAGLPPGDG